MERKEAEAHEQQMKGPGSFPLERLLAIFRCIVVENVDSAHGFGQFGSPSHPNLNLEEAEGDGDVTEELSADVLMQLSTLVSVNLLSKSSTNPLEGNARYRCNVDGNLIQKVPFSLTFSLLTCPCPFTPVQVTADSERFPSIRCSEVSLFRRCLLHRFV
jgi:origin recognition complex subunit 5